MLIQAWCLKILKQINVPIWRPSKMVIRLFALVSKFSFDNTNKCLWLQRTYTNNLVTVYAPVYIGVYSPNTTDSRNISASIPTEKIPEEVAKEDLSKKIKASFMTKK